MGIGTRLLVFFNGSLVGTDDAGNRYFIERRPRAAGARLRRWVLYRGATAAASVPQAWQSWLNFPTGAGALPGPTRRP